MKKFVFFLAAIILALSFQSCSIHQKIHFNRNYSGTYQMTVNMSEAMAFMSMMDTTGSMEGADMMMEMFKGIDSMDLRGKYESIDGISDVYIEPVDDGAFVVEYKFDGLSALNASQDQMDALMDGMGAGLGGASMGIDTDDGASSGFEPFVLDKKKTLTHQSEKTEQPPFGDMGGMEGMDGEEMLSGLGEMFSFRTDYSFARKIKSVESEGLVIENQDNHSVSTKMDFEKMKDLGAYRITFKLK